MSQIETLIQESLHSRIDAISRGNAPESDRFNWTDEEETERASIILSAIVADRWPSVSSTAFARFFCTECKGHLFAPETVIYVGIQYHIGCGGRVDKCEF